MFPCFAAIDIKEEASVSTLLVNVDNKFDPFDAMSTPLYQTATFKQVLRHYSLYLVKILSLDAVFFFPAYLKPSAIENGSYDYTRSGNPTRDALER